MVTKRHVKGEEERRMRRREEEKKKEEEEENEEEEIYLKLLQETLSIRTIKWVVVASSRRHPVERSHPCPLCIKRQRGCPPG